MRKSVRFFAAILCLLLLNLCIACRSRSTSGLIPIRLQTDWYPQPEMGGFYQAQLQGLYKAAGLDVTIAPGGPYIISDQQVAIGAAEFGMGASDKVLVSVSRGLPLVAIAATMQQDPQALMVHAASPVHTFADLEGHTVAVQPGSSWFAYVVSRYHLQRVRETPSTLTVANFLQDPDYIQQCFVTSEPYFARKAGADPRTLLISSSGFQPYRAYFTSQAFLAAHPDIVQKFVAASTLGWKNYLQDPSMVDAQLAKLNPAMSPGQMQFSIDTLKSAHFLEGENTPESHLGHMTVQRWTTLYQQLSALKVIEHPIDPTTAFTLQYAP